MPRFPHLDQLAIPATFTKYVPGRLHPDGRRYLPLLVFDIGIDARSASWTDTISSHPNSKVDMARSRSFFCSATSCCNGPATNALRLVPERCRIAVEPRLLRMLMARCWRCRHGRNSAAHCNTNRCTLNFYSILALGLSACGPPQPPTALPTRLARSASKPEIGFMSDGPESTFLDSQIRRNVVAMCSAYCSMSI